MNIFLNFISTNIRRRSNRNQLTIKFEINADIKNLLILNYLI
jgi:hypothetical protein